MTRAGLAQAAFWLALLTLASRLLGLVREMVVASAYGIRPELDLFWVAMTVPDLIGSNALFVALYLFVPAYLHEREHAPEAADRFAGAFLQRAAAVLLLISAGLYAAAPWIADRLAPGLAPELRGLLVLLTRWCSLIVLGRGLEGALRGVLHAHRRFLVPAIAGFLVSGSVIAMVWAFAPAYGVKALAWGIAAGNLLPLVVMFPVAWRAAPWRLARVASHPALGRMARLVPWFVGIEVAGLAMPLVDRVIAVRMLEPGAISALSYARALADVPVTLLAMTVATVLFPSLAVHAARAEREVFQETLRRGVRAVVVLLLPVACLLVVLPDSLVRALYERGAFGPEETALTGAALAAYGAGLLFLGIAAPLIQAAYAAGRVRYLLGIRLGGLATKVLLSLVLAPVLGHVGLALATGGAFLMVSLALIPALNGGWRGLVPDLRIVLPGLLLAVGLALVADRALERIPGEGFLKPWLIPVGSWALALVGYLAVCARGNLAELAWARRLLPGRKVSGHP